MKKLLLFILSAIAVFGYFACGKTVPDNPACTDMSPASDSSALIKFAGDSIKLSWDSTGLYYHIIDSGSATNKPIFSSQITVNYIGRLMNNVLFDSASNTNLNGYPLYNLILGWRIGMTKIGAGGHIQLFIPSAYGYGCTGYGPVPANAPLFYDVELLGVN